MLAEERGRVLASLAEPLVAVGEVRARLLDDLPVEPDVEHRALPGDPVAVDDVELGLLERRRDLVLHHLDADAVADRLDALLERLDAADVEADGRVELERATSGRRLGVPEHDADLLAQLVREDRNGAGLVQRAGELAERLAHQACLEPDVAVAHLALDLGARRERGDRVDRDDVERARADQELGDLERLLAVVGLRDEEVVDVHADVTRILGIHRVLGVDERADPAAALRLRDHVVDEGRLPRRLRPEDLDHAPPGKPADSERDVERQRPGRDRCDRDLRLVAHLHHRALAVCLLDLAEGGVECLLAVHGF